MATNNLKKWYVVRSIGGQEKKVRDYIVSEIERNNLSDYVGKVLVPSETAVQIRNGKKITIDKVSFPGYVMLEANLTGELPHVIKSVTGVVGFLGETKGGAPLPMRKTEIDRMLGRLDEISLRSETVVIPYTFGETVKVVDGPFKGFDGVIDELNDEKRKLKVIVKVFGRATPLELSYMQVDKIT